jgi:hypothetical protein
VSMKGCFRDSPVTKIILVTLNFTVTQKLCDSLACKPQDSGSLRGCVVLVSVFHP